MVNAAQTLAETEVWEKLQILQYRLQQESTRCATLDQIGRTLRKEGFPADIAAAITGQLQLRRDAEAKFGNSAQHMLFTRDGLEQATRFPVSFLHALRYRQAEVNRVADLGCGIGADAIALAEVGLSVVALDRDAEAAACATVNLRSFPNCEVLIGDINDVTPAWLAGKEVSGIFLDPARRVAGRRVLRPEEWSPTWNRVEEIFSWGFPTGVKVAPGIDHERLNFGSMAEWTSVDGELVEAALWSEQLSPAGPGRSAQVIVNGTPHLLHDPHTPAANAPVRQAPVGPIGDYLFEPDGAVIRAGAISYLAEQTGTHLLHSHIAYLTGSEAQASPFFTGFEVKEVLPLRQKQVLGALRNLGAGSIEVKKRGTNIDTSQWQRELQKKLTPGAGRPLVVIATRTDTGHAAIIASRLTPTKLGG